MDAWGLTDPGLKRQGNQDTFRIEHLPHDSLLAVVCDGMGGARSGNVASQVAADAFTEAVRKGLKRARSAESAEHLMTEAVLEANRTVYELARLRPECSGMGTTLVAVLLQNRQTTVVHVGDSRAYLCRREGIEQLTVDHSVVSLMVQRGELSREEAKRYPGRNLITRAIGTNDTTRSDVSTIRPEKGDFLLLCSDGLSNELADQEILFEILHGGTRESCCSRLVELTKMRGAPDNVTAVLVCR